MQDMPIGMAGKLPDPLHVICFTGPRPSKLPDKGDEKAASIIEIGRRLEQAVERSVSEGKSVFLNGCMAGLDVMAGETVLRLKEKYPHIRCVTVAPFRVNFFRSAVWTPEWKNRALALYSRSDIAFCLSETYHKRVYYERDAFLVDHSGAVICYYAGTGGGTKYTLDYAARKRLPIHNISEGMLTE